MINMTPEARAQMNAYKRKWNHEHRDKVKQYQRKYWEKKAKQMQKEKVTQNDVTE